MNRNDVNTGSKFYVRAIWDEENKIWYSDTNIIGLFIETETLEEFEEVKNEFADELIEANHSTENEDQLKEFCWTVPFNRPVDAGIAAP